MKKRSIKPEPEMLNAHADKSTGNEANNEALREEGLALFDKVEKKRTNIGLQTIAQLAANLERKPAGPYFNAGATDLSLPF